MIIRIALSLRPAVLVTLTLTYTSLSTKAAFPFPEPRLMAENALTPQLLHGAMAMNETQVLGLTNTFGYYFYVLTYNVEVDCREWNGSSRYVNDDEWHEE